MKIDLPPATGALAEPWSMSKIIKLMAVFGPAAIVASVSIGAGETIVVVRAGAWAGYDLLWLVLLSVIVKGLFVTYLIGRYTAISGEYIGHRLVQLPGPRGWLLLALTFLELGIAPLSWVAISRPCGDLVHHLVSPHSSLLAGSEIAWENAITCFFIALAMLLGLKLSFDRLEKQQLLICLILVSGTAIGTLMVMPDFLRAFLGSITIQLPSFPSWAPRDAVDHPMLTMATAFGYVGGGVFVYIAYSNWVGLHGWGLGQHQDIAAIRKHAFNRPRIDYLPDGESNAKRLRQLAAPLRWDVGMGAVVLFLVTAAFMLSGAAVLYPLQTQFEGWSLLTNQAHVWATIHPTLVWIYYVCIIAALWGTLQVCPEMYARVTQEFFEAVWPNRTWNYGRIKRLICLYIFIVSSAVIWLDIPFDILIQIAGFMLANLGIALLMPAVIYLNYQLPAAYRTRPIILVGAVAAAVVLMAFAGISGHGLYGKLAG